MEKTKKSEGLPERYRLPIIKEMEELEARIKAEADRRNEENEREIEAKLKSLETVDKELREKIEVLENLKEEYRELFKGFESLETEKGEELERERSKVKVSKISFQEFEKEKEKINKNFQDKKEQLTERISDLEQSIRELDSEVQKRRLTWATIDERIRLLAVARAQMIFQAWERRREGFKARISAMGAYDPNTFKRELQVHQHNFQRNVLTSPLVLEAISPENLWKVCLDSRIPDSYLPEVKKIIEKASIENQRIRLTLLPEGHASGERLRVINLPQIQIEVRKND